MDESTRNTYDTEGGAQHDHAHAHGEKKDHRHPHLHRGRHEAKDLSWHREHYAFDRKKGYPSTLGPVSNPDGTGVCLDKKVHEHHHGFFCHHKNSKIIQKKGTEDGEEGDNKNKMQNGAVAEKGNESHGKASGLRIRMWLESRNKEEKGRQFASYECVVPDLVGVPKGV
jgi:hypothetical protein